MKFLLQARWLPSWRPLMIGSRGLSACGNADDDGDVRVERHGTPVPPPPRRSHSCPRTSATPTSTPATPVARRPSRSSAATTPRSARRPAAPTPRCSTSTPRRSSAPAALVVSANDPKAICDALNEAREAGTKVVTFDSDTDPDCRDLFVNQATAEGIAKVQVDLIAKQIGDTGEIAILSASANATNQNAWIDMMKADLAANHPNVKLVDVVYGNDDDQTSFDKTAALLQSHPNLKGIISPTTVGIAAAARYLSTSDKKGKVYLTGLGTPNR